MILWHPSSYKILLFCVTFSDIFCKLIKVPVIKENWDFRSNKLSSPLNSRSFKSPFSTECYIHGYFVSYQLKQEFYTIFHCLKKISTQIIIVTCSREIHFQSDSLQKADLVVSLLQVKLPHNNFAARNQFFAGYQALPELMRVMRSV